MADKTSRVDAAEISEVSLTVGAAVATTGATNSSPYGYTAAAQADAIVTRLNQLIVDVTALQAQVAEIRSTLIA